MITSTDYSWEDSSYTETYECSHCHYRYKRKRTGTWDEDILEGDKPFVRILEVALYEDERGDVQKITRNICPKCGIVQVDIGDL